MTQNANTQALSDAGVSIWLDDLSRGRLQTGNLAELIASRNIVGVTTNPSIFQAAISGSDGYDSDITRLAGADGSVDGSGDRVEKMMGATQTLERTGVRTILIDAQRSAGRHEIRDDVRCRRRRLVAGDVGVLARIEIALAGVENNRLAVGIVGFVERHRSRDHRDKHWAGMTVPPAVTSRLEGDRLSGDVKRGSGLHFHLPYHRRRHHHHLRFGWSLVHSK